MQPEEVNKNQENPTTQPPPQEPAEPEATGPVVQDVVAPEQPTNQVDDSAQAPTDEVKMPPAQSTQDSEADMSAREVPGSTPESAETSKDSKKKTKPVKPEKSAKTKSKTAKPVGFIVGVIVVALGLMALVVMMYINQDQESTEDPAVTPETSTPVTEEATEPELNEDVFLDDENDLDEDETLDQDDNDESDNENSTEPEQEPETE